MDTPGILNCVCVHCSTSGIFSSVCVCSFSQESFLLRSICLLHCSLLKSPLYITKTCLFKYIEILPPKTENFQIKNADIFHISAQNIDYGYSLEPPWRGGSNEYPQSIFLSRNK